MLKIVSSVCAAVMALTIPMATPAMAVPIGATSAPAYDRAPVVNVQGPEAPMYRPRPFDLANPGASNAPRYRENRRYREDRRVDRRYDGPRGGYDRPGYYRGHRGYRDRRAGYRYHDGFWFPPAAFIAGAIVGGAIANPPAQYRPRGGNAHIDWCSARYRSYRASDNTFQPYNGPRRQCTSPYG